MRSGRVTLTHGPEIWDAEVASTRLVVSGDDVLLLVEWEREDRYGTRHGGQMVLRVSRAEYSAAAQSARLVAQ